MASQQHDQLNAGPDVQVASRTHVGLRRERNEDFLGMLRTTHGFVMIVCDGMGGHAGGEVASRIAVEAALQSIEDGAGDHATLLRTAVTDANNALLVEKSVRPELGGMGTTFVAALLDGDRVTIANVGDSRAYLLRSDGRLERVTTDHSLVAEMVARGEITQAEAERHPRRNVITRALGAPDGVAPDLVELTLALGDTLLLATDGLHGMVDDAVIERALRAPGDVAPVCDALVQAALDGGGADNVTVLLARVRGGGGVGAGAAPGGVDETPTDPGTPPPEKRGPRGFGLILGVGFGAVAFIALLIFLLRFAMVAVQERSDDARDSVLQRMRDSIAADSAARIYPDRAGPAPGGDSMPSAGAWGDSAGALQRSRTDSLPRRDSVRSGDTLHW